MSVPILLSGFSESDPVPGVYFQINHAVGEGSTSNAEYALLFIGNKLTSGDATVDSEIYGPLSVLPLLSDADWVSRFGSGSELHRMYLASKLISPNMTRYAIANTQSVGAQATGTVTFVTTATAAASVRVYVGNEYVDVAISSGDTVTAIAAAVVVAINQKISWGVTATSALGVVTITAKQNGLRGNDIRYMASLPAGATTTVSPTVCTAFTGGTTADSFTSALATISAKRYYYIVTPTSDTTLNGAIMTQVNSVALPLNGNLTQRLVSGSVATLGTATAAAITHNGARMEIVHHEKCPWTPAEIAAHMATIYLYEEASDVTNFAGYGKDTQSELLWGVPASRVTSTHPTRVALVSALNNGVSPIAVDNNGKTYLVNRITTKSLTSSAVDYRIRDAHKVTVCDKYADTGKALITLRYPRHKISDNPASNAPPLPGNVVYPQLIKQCLSEVVNTFADRGLVENAAEIVAGIVCQRETAPTTRITAVVDLQTIDNFYQAAFITNQVS